MIVHLGRAWWSCATPAAVTLVRFVIWNRKLVGLPRRTRRNSDHCQFLLLRVPFDLALWQGLSELIDAGLRYRRQTQVKDGEIL